MRVLILTAGLLLAMNAMADNEHKPLTVSKPIDKATPVLMSAGNSCEATDAADAKEMHNRSKGRAQDYNSSRSNNSSRTSDQSDCVARPDAAASGGSRARDYNSSRSNNVNGAALGPANDRPTPTRAQDYNSSRSNTTAVRPEVDDEVVCADGVDDDCDGAVDEAPANHNTTRSR